MDAVNRKMDNLKTIVSQSGSISTLSGFIGGVQTVGVWGIIVVLVIGFVLLAVYIKSTNSKPKSRPPHIPPTGTGSSSRPSRFSHGGLSFASILGLSFGISSTVAYFYLNPYSPKSSTPAVLSATVEATKLPTSAPTAIPTIVTEKETDLYLDEPVEESVLPTSTLAPTSTPTIIPTITKSTPTPANLKPAIVVPSLNSYVNVRVSGDRNATQISRILSGSEVLVNSESTSSTGEHWYEITQGQIHGWVLGQFIQYINSSSLMAPSSKVTIAVPAHDTVYIYAKPSFNASITKKITVSQEVEILLETKMWAKIILPQVNVSGWVSQDFISKNY